MRVRQRLNRALAGRLVEHAVAALMAARPDEVATVGAHRDRIDIVMTSGASYVYATTPDGAGNTGLMFATPQPGRRQLPVWTPKERSRA